MVRTATLVLALALATAAQAAPAKKAPPKRPSPPAYQVPASGTLDRLALMKIASSAMSSGPKDPFNDHPSAKYAGRHFLIAQRIKADGANDATVNATWSYDRARQVLTVSLSKYESSFTVYFTSKRTGSHVGQNAFGVKTQVSEYSETTVSVLADSKPPTGDGYTVEIQASPEVAKSLTTDLMLFVEGDLVSSDGSVASCETRTDDATIDDPVEVFELGCSVRANVTEIRFATSDKVYDSWTAAAPAVEGSLQVYPIGGSPPAPRPTGKVISRPEWIRQPSNEDIARYYPDRALRMEVSGRATLSCIVDSRGTPTDCTVVSEYPADYGFGEAALKTARLMRMKPTLLDGEPTTGASVLVPITFTLPR